MRETSDQNQFHSGIVSLIGCFILWGVLPVYWKTLSPISSWTVIFYRIVLVCVCAILLAKRKYSLKEIFFPLFHDRKLALKYLAAGAVISLNWSTYIWAVSSGYVIQSSIGYYIEPLMVCLFGILFFREKLTVCKGIALGIVLLAIGVLLIHFHQIPGIALGLALSFSVYAAIKKSVTQPPLISLVYETFFFSFPALAVVFYLEITGQGALASGQPYQYVLLLFCGLLTVIPLALFGSAAQKVSMFTLGLLEYISPTISMILAIFLFREPFDRIQFLAFLIIWIGLGFFTVGEFRSQTSANPSIDFSSSALKE